MKKLLLVLTLLMGVLSFSTLVEARATRVRGYYKPSTGRYVYSYYKTTPNRSKYDNFSTRGNYNPYTGRMGTVDPFRY